MKVLVLSSYATTGGAAVAANRLCSALERNGVEVKMLCRRNLSWWPGKKPQSWTSIIERGIIWIANGFSMKNLWTTDIALLGQNITRTKEFQEADVIHLHWINQGFVSLRTLEEILNSGKKIVFTMHDMWYCTSICHHAYECEKYEYGCRECRALALPGKNDLSAKIFKRKMGMFSGRHVDIVSVSSWLADKARKSAFLKSASIHVIPNFISMSDFSLLGKSESRSSLNISQDARVIVFCAARIDDPIKGFDIFIKALNVLVERKPEMKDSLLLRLIGDIRNADILKDIPIMYNHLGVISDKKRINKEYCAADVLASTSHFETFGQTLIEAQASGCIPVSFGQGGQREVISHRINGYIVDRQTPENFADGLAWAITEGRTIKSEDLRKHVEDNYSEDVVVMKYLSIYNKL